MAEIVTKTAAQEIVNDREEQFPTHLAICLIQLDVRRKRFFFAVTGENAAEAGVLDALRGLRGLAVIRGVSRRGTKY